MPDLYSIRIVITPFAWCRPAHERTVLNTTIRCGPLGISWLNKDWLERGKREWDEFLATRDRR